MQTEHNIEASETESVQPATWHVVVRGALEELGGEAHLSQLYEHLKGHPKALANRHFKATIRQTVQKYPDFERVVSGIWRLTDETQGTDVQEA